MKKLNTIILAATAALAVSARAQTTAFTFQGRLNDANGPVTGTYDMTFTVWTAVSSGSQIAGPITNSAVAVGGGLFTVSLNFGSGIFTGTNYWVEMSVCTNGAGTFATLAPRQQLTPTPYALYARQSSNSVYSVQAGTATIASSANALASSAPQYNSLCPPGSIMAYGGATAPAGWLLCNGGSYSTSTYSSLFAAIGYAYGGGGSSFNVPDCRGVFLRGVDSGRGLDSGRSLGSYQDHALQNITGGVGLVASGIVPPSGAFYNSSATGKDWSSLGTVASQIMFDASRVVNTSTETRPRNVSVNYIIKY